MPRTSTPLAALAVGVFLVSAELGSPAQGAEIKVLSAAVMKPVLLELAGQFEQASGHRLTISYVPAGAARKLVEAGEIFDVAILQRPAAEEVARLGKIDLSGLTTIARSGLAVAVRHGMKKPDIGSVDAFKQALLAAKSISYPDPAEGHAAGALFRQIIERLGIAEQVNAKAKLQKHPFSESPPQDYADLAIAQPTEILITPSFDLLDLIPEDLQDYNRFSWSIGVATHAREPAAAAALIRFLTSSKAALVMKKKGMEPGAL
ncbi:MAG TPA: substrate-binding domain-containing protein [Xanthobacteraceae bacterium]|nr:substrate-binding domain-containing protein [Xanthobacteraceae bacterium]